jgi:hypothetical protein
MLCAFNGILPSAISCGIYARIDIILMIDNNISILRFGMGSFSENN